MSERLFYPATERNRDPILTVLKQYLPAQGQVLEVASGSGEHITHFAQHFPAVDWQPSDLDPACLESIQAWCDFLGLDNVYAPLQLDTTTQDNWPKTELDALICINMVHISPWEATKGLMKKAGDLLQAGGILYLYGPYRRNGIHTAPSNAAFERSLQAQDGRFAIRDIGDVEVEGALNGLHLREVIEMPANNFSLVFQRG